MASKSTSSREKLSQEGKQYIGGREQKEDSIQKIYIYNVRINTAIIDQVLITIIAGNFDRLFSKSNT